MTTNQRLAELEARNSPEDRCPKCGDPYHSTEEWARANHRAGCPVDCSYPGWDIEAIEQPRSDDHPAPCELWAIDPDTCDGTPIGIAFPHESADDLDRWLKLKDGMRLSTAQINMVDRATAL